MDRRSIAGMLFVVVVGIGSAVKPTACRACGLFNCFKRNPTPVTAYYPPTTAATTPATTANYGGCCGTAQCEQTVLRYVPQVAYRTVWQPVPVTTYRRTVSSNPTTGLPITCTQPCTTYTYQARRVPYTTFRPVYTTEPVSTSPTVAPTTVAPTTVAPNPAIAAPAPCGCNTTGAGWTTTGPTAGPSYAPAPSSQPSYSQPGYTQPPSYGGPTYAPPSDAAPPPGGATDATGATPWEPVQPSTGAGASPGAYGSGSSYAPAGGSYDASGGVGPTTPDPASDRPRIPPTIDPNLNGGSATWQPAAGGLPSSAPSSRLTTRGYSDASPQAAGDAAEVTPWTTVRPEVTSPPSFPMSAAGPGGAASTTGGNDWSTNSRETAPYTIRPLPKVDLPPPPQTDSSLDPPPLLNDSRDRTAVRPIPARPIPARWASNRIQWPERTVGHQVELVPAPAADRASLETPRRLDPHRIPLKRFDSDSSKVDPVQGTGWRSARR